MNYPIGRRVGVLCALMLLTAFLIGCNRKDNSRWEEAQQKSKENPSAAVSKEATEGGSLNKFFPKQEAPYDIVFKQEKKGYAEASLKKSGSDVATFSLSDTTSTPDVAAKYQSSTEKIGGYPARSLGSSITSILVGDRYQVQARSKGPSFTKEDREAWLQKFDLSGLSQLK